MKENQKNCYNYYVLAVVRAFPWRSLWAMPSTSPSTFSFVFPKKPSYFFVLQHWVKRNTIPANLTSSNHKFPAPVICAAIGLEDVVQRVTWKKIVPPVEKRLLWNESWPQLIIYPIYVLVAILKWKQRSSLPSIYITFTDVLFMQVHTDNH